MTLPNEEYRAAHHIEKSGFKYYLPIARFPDQSGQLRIRGVLFPRYIFIMLKMGWEHLLRIPGIFRFFMLGERPIPVPAYDINRLRKMEDKDGVISLPSPKPSPKILRPGARAKIQGNGVRDAFAGHTCRVVFLHELSNTCEVMLTLMGRDVRTVLPQASLNVIV